MLSIIRILHQTTTFSQKGKDKRGLSIIRILHQTTTTYIANIFTHRCLLSGFYIKPQPAHSSIAISICCLLSGFYIKPQHGRLPDIERSVVYYQDSTSNHNTTLALPYQVPLSIIRILHQTTTNNVGFIVNVTLSIIRILHQTTTALQSDVLIFLLSIIRILHQTTTRRL